MPTNTDAPIAGLTYKDALWSQRRPLWTPPPGVARMKAIQGRVATMPAVMSTRRDGAQEQQPAQEPDRSHLRERPLELVRRFDADPLNLYASAYNRGCNLSQFLEREDPTSEYPTEERDLDAFERCLEAADVHVAYDPVTGQQASYWEDFGGRQATPGLRALAAEFQCRAWRRASSIHPANKEAILGADQWGPSDPHQRAILLSGDVATGALVNPWYDNPEIRAKRLVPPIPLEAIVARTTALDTDAYRTLYIVDDFGTDAYRMKRVIEGTEIPSTALVTGEHYLRINKFGRAIRATYEQLRRQRVDRIAFLLSRMAIQAEMDKVADAINTVINGDGNSNTSTTTVAMYNGGAGLGATGTGIINFNLTVWIRFRLQFALTYAPNIVLGQSDIVGQLLTMPVGQGAGLMPLALMPANPFGVVGPIAQQLAGGIRYGITTSVATNNLLAFNSDDVLEMVTEIGGNVAEVERFITNQTQIMTMTEVIGWGIIDANGARMMNAAA